MIDSAPPPTVPSPAALAWAAAAIGPAASVREVRRLAGGAHAATHLLRTADPAADLVLRRFPAGDPAAEREARILGALGGLNGLAPELVATDPSGEFTGTPASLITRVPGHADIAPADPLDAAAQLGRTLARLHALPLAGLAQDGHAQGGRPQSGHTEGGHAERIGALRDGLAAATPSGGGSGPAAAVVAEGRHRLAAQPAVLTHFDYWSGNVLWQDGRLTGVIDWSGASLAPRGLDVGWCRLDLAVLHGPTAADAFLHAYHRAAGVEVPELPLWDLFACANSHASVENWLPNYHDLGRADLTAGTLRRRHTEWTASALASHAGPPR